ncbi:hypothetical protein [Pandoraea anapnoica]|uniref:hypothetical protein n=1 Tax=Pandoraea anapnoica TaxID=2508301 RepID=UPI001FE5C242|nr:hypothetical protein [Pandoraea anapnoica]
MDDRVAIGPVIFRDGTFVEVLTGTLAQGANVDFEILSRVLAMTITGHRVLALLGVLFSVLGGVHLRILL